MNERNYNLLRFEGFFMGVAGTGAFVILASTISGREPDSFLFSVMPWVTVLGGLGSLLVWRAQRRLKRKQDNG